MRAERRKHRRVKELAKYQLQANIITDGRAVPVTLLDVSFAGIGLSVTHTHGLVLNSGQVVVIQLKAPSVRQPIRARARVMSRIPGSDSDRYGLALQDAAWLRSRVPPSLMGIFNRRRSFRVTPDSLGPIEVRLEREDGRQTTLPAVCVSSSGMAIIAATREQEMLMTGDRISIDFMLPYSGTRCELVGVVRYTVRRRTGVRYGIEFDADACEDFARQERALARYVMTQQRRTLAAEQELVSSHASR